MVTGYNDTFLKRVYILYFDVTRGRYFPYNANPASTYPDLFYSIMFLPLPHFKTEKLVAHGHG
jgi:hypothetical protein